jgi:hypothetical protein
MCKQRVHGDGLRGAHAAPVYATAPRRAEGGRAVVPSTLWEAGVIEGMLGRRDLLRL